MTLISLLGHMLLDRDVEVRLISKDYECLYVGSLANLRKSYIPRDGYKVDFFNITQTTMTIFVEKEGNK